MEDKNARNHYLWELISASNCLQDHSFDEAVIGVIKKEIVRVTCELPENEG